MNKKERRKRKVASKTTLQKFKQPDVWSEEDIDHENETNIIRVAANKAVKQANSSTQQEGEKIDFWGEEGGELEVNTDTTDNNNEEEDEDYDTENDTVRPIEVKRNKFEEDPMKKLLKIEKEDFANHIDEYSSTKQNTFRDINMENDQLRKEEEPSFQIQSGPFLTNTPCNNNDDDKNKSDHQTRYPPSEADQIKIISDIKKVVDESKNYRNEVKDLTTKFYQKFYLKTVEKIGLFKDLIDEEQLKNDFETVFVLSKTAVYCNSQIAKYETLASGLKAFSNVFCQTFHNKLVVPIFENVIHSDILKNAYITFQSIYNKESEIDKHECISYIIQHEIENNKIINVPHPLMKCFNADMKAFCSYLTSLITNTITTSL